MSNSIINYHILDGEPAGDGATLDEIADYYGDLLFEIRPLPDAPEPIVCDNPPWTDYGKIGGRK